MIDSNYNFKRHIELLKKQRKTFDDNKSFWKENPKEALELSEYSAKVSRHLVWEDRFEIASVIQDFLSKKIDETDLQELYTTIEKMNFNFQKVLNEE